MLVGDGELLPGFRQGPHLAAAGYFDDSGFPSGKGWDEIAFPAVNDEHVYALEVSGSAIKFTLGEWREQGCTPERARRDGEMIEALSQVTAWRQRNDVVIFSGATELRFRLSTH